MIHSASFNALYGLVECFVQVTAAGIFFISSLEALAADNYCRLSFQSAHVAGIVLYHAHCSGHKAMHGGRTRVFTLDVGIAHLVDNRS